MLHSYNMNSIKNYIAKKNTGDWFTLFFIFAFIALSFYNIFWGIIGVHIPYSSGERSVKIIKLSEKGLIWKTWEVEGILTQGQNNLTYIWQFSVDSNEQKKSEILSLLQKAFDSGETVKIKYVQQAGSVPWRGDTSYFVKDILFPVNK